MEQAKRAVLAGVAATAPKAKVANYNTAYRRWFFRAFAMHGLPERLNPWQVPFAKPQGGIPALWHLSIFTGAALGYDEAKFSKGQPAFRVTP